MATPGDTTQLLRAVGAGDRSAFDALYARLYDELRAIARQRILGRHDGGTLNTGALVHEAYLRLVDQSRIELRDRAHFLALASRAMRFVLVDFARARTAGKRGAGVQPVPLDAVQLASPDRAADRAADLIALDDALERLAAFDERLAGLVEFRFFGGLTYEEIAAATGRSVPTVKRDWSRARAWLYREMHEG